MTPAGRAGCPCISRVSKLSTEDRATEFEGVYCSILKSGVISLAMETDGVEDWSVKTLDMRLSLVVLTTVTVTPLFTPQGTDGVLQTVSEPQRV
jgi:hypothetical protein